MASSLPVYADLRLSLLTAGDLASRLPGGSMHPPPGICAGKVQAPCRPQVELLLRKNAGKFRTGALDQKVGMFHWGNGGVPQTG